MPEFGEVVYTLTDLVIAALNSDGTYGTSLALDYGQSLTIEPIADNDTLKAFGMNVELLSVPIGAKFTLAQGSVQFAALEILLGLTAVDSGTTPNQISTLDMLGGGAGLPYFGIIGKMASINGGAFKVGGFKAKLDSIPQIGVEQNKFVLPEVTGQFAAQNTTTRKLFRIKREETAAAIGTVSDFLS